MKNCFGFFIGVYYNNIIDKVFIINDNINEFYPAVFLNIYSLKS